MYRILSQSQPSAFGPTDFLLDLDSEEVLAAIDVRDYSGPINPQLADAMVIVLYPDDYAWIFGGLQQPDYSGYIKQFKRYDEYCSWFNKNTESWNIN